MSQMKQKKLKTNAIMNIGNFINQQQNINVEDKTFEKLMLI